MKVDVKVLRHQCGHCGAPVDVVEVLDVPSALVRQDPCGHEAKLGKT